MTNITMNAIVCSKCSRHRAFVCCICTYPPFLLCPADVASHIQKSLDQGQFHLMVDPAVYTERQEVIESKKPDFVRLGIAHRRLREKLAAIELSHQSLIEQAFDSAQQRLQSLKTAEIQRLQVYIKRISRYVDKAISDTSYHAFSPQPPKTIFEQFIARPAEAQDPWFRLEITEELAALQSAVKLEYGSELVYVQECFEQEPTLPDDDVVSPGSAVSLPTFPPELDSPNQQPLNPFTSEYPRQMFYSVRNQELKHPFQLVQCECGLMAVKGEDKCVFCLGKRAKISEDAKVEGKRENEGRLEQSRKCAVCGGQLQPGERVCQRCQLDISALSDTVSARNSLIPDASPQHQQYSTAPPQTLTSPGLLWQCSFCGYQNDDKKTAKCGNCSQMRRIPTPKVDQKSARRNLSCEKCHITDTVSADPRSGKLLCIRCMKYTATERQPTQWKCSVCMCYNPASSGECVKCRAKCLLFCYEQKRKKCAECKCDIGNCEYFCETCLRAKRKNWACRHCGMQNYDAETCARCRKIIR